MSYSTRLVIASLFLLQVLSHFSCEHTPVTMDDEDMMPVDTNTVDTTTVTDMPCDPEIVYFDLQVLPILQSNCAFSGCHDEASAEDGVILTSYENVIATADVEPFNLDDSEIYEVLVHSDLEERMPPVPADPLSADQINTIAKWILQGGEDLHCDPNASGCDTDDVSFAQDIQPVLATHCEGCHSGATPAGAISLDNYDGVKVVADNGKLFGAVNWDADFEAMPQGGDQLNQCVIDQLEAWIADGALNN